MNMSISDRELDTIISAMRLGGDVALYQKLQRIRDGRNDKLNGSYNKNTTEEFGFVL